MITAKNLSNKILKSLKNTEEFNYISFFKKTILQKETSTN